MKKLILFYLLILPVLGVAQDLTYYKLGQIPETRWTGIVKAEPENVNTSGKYPVIIFLHGRGNHGTDLARFYSSSIPSGVKAQVSKGVILIAPQTQDYNTFFNYAHLNLVNQLIKKIPYADLNRVYVTGLSLGGYGSWVAGQEFSSFYAAIVPICGCGDANKAKNMVNLPVWAFHNDRDPVVNPICTTAMIEAITKAGGKPKVTWYNSTSHDAWTRAYNDSNMWTWLLAQSKGGITPEPVEVKPTATYEQVREASKKLDSLINILSVK